MSTPLRWTSPAALRNQGPILDVLQRVLPASGRLLEIASGSGQHAAYCAARLPGWTWQPSDADPAALASIRAWAADAQGPGPLDPLALDVLAADWPEAGGLVGRFDAVFNANMLHIAPWAACAGLMRGAARCLVPAGRLVTYGPYRVAGEPTAPSNEAFDADLRGRHPAWGLRWLHDVQAEAEAAGLVLRERLAMPSNNLMLVFERA